jgi:predicted TIM-barrel fold metal-dependent hydrolase
MQGFAPLGPEARRLYETAAREGLAVLIHPDHRTEFRFRGEDRSNFLTNEKLCRLIEEHPGLRLVAAHLGSRHSDRLEAAIKASPGAMLDVAILKVFYPDDPAMVAATIRRFGVDRVMLGSDFPFWPQESALAYLDRLDLTAEERRAIEVDNPKRFLGI